MNRPLFLTAVVLAAPLATAATHLVLPPDTDPLTLTIQETIDQAQAGDIIAISGGNFFEDLTIDKSVRLVEVQGETVNLYGLIRFLSVVDAPSFDGFDIKDQGSGIVVENTTGLVLNEIVQDNDSDLGLEVKGASSVAVVGGAYSRILQQSGELTTTRTVVRGNFEARAGASKTVAFRTEVSGYVIWESLRAWFGYSKANTFWFGGDNARVVVVGAEIDREYGPEVRFDLAGNQVLYNAALRLDGTGNDLLVANSVLKGVSFARHPVHGGWWGGGPGIGIWLSDPNNRVRIYNNYIELKLTTDPGTNTNTLWPGASLGDGIRSEGTNAELYNNLIVGAQGGITAPKRVLAYNNFYHDRDGSMRAQERGLDSSQNDAVVGFESASGDPLLVAGQEPDLQPGSPCIDGGLDDGLFLDLDGSRNDVGPSGGCFYDPDGWTTPKPVVISFDLGPQRLQEGVGTDVRISEGVAVEQP